MQEDKNSENQEEQNQRLRFKLLPLFTTNITVQLLPLHIIQIITQVVSYLQILKFSVDYRTVDWLGYQLPIFSYLDISYYVNLMVLQNYTAILVISIIYVALFSFVQIAISILGVSYSNLAANVRKIFLFVTKNILFMPFLNLILKQFSCLQISAFTTCFQKPNTILMAISICIFVVFVIFVTAQSFLNFQFLADKRQYVRLKKSSYTSVVFLAYVIINELNYLFLTDPAKKAVADLSTTALLVFLIIKDEELNQQIKLLQIAFVTISLLALLILDIQLIFGKSLGIFLYIFLSVFIFASIMQSKTWSIKFQLENINKWTTPDVMIRYSNNLSYFLTKKDQYMFLVFIYGYMEIHRQKCDSLECPTRCLLSDALKNLLNIGQLDCEDEQLLRVNNLIKEIFRCGYLLTPISPELQLENSTFLYENNQKQLALKNLLMIKYEKLSLDKYYRYHNLKEKVKKQINQEPNKNFLDLVSEMEIKREQQEIIKKFEKAAMINLQFWSCLNEDYPDFLKINEVASARIEINEEVKRSYQLICRIAHSERITVIFVNYLDSIQNDELVFNEIYAKIKQQYSLNQRIILQDWNSTSHQIMMVNIEDSSYGQIVDVNSSCGTLLGYQKFQLVNQNIKLIFLDAFKDFIKEFLTPNSEEKTFYLTHKSGYLLKVSAKAQYYNSMSTGMTAIISINVNLFPYSGFFIIDRNQKIVGISASILPLAGLDSKAFEGEVATASFFQFDINTIVDKAELKQQYFSLRQLIKPDFQVEQIEKESKRFKIYCAQNESFKIFELNTLHLHDKTKQKADMNLQRSRFQFKVSATVNQFKYFGSCDDEGSHISQFGELNDMSQQNQLLKKIDYSQEISTLRLYENKIQIIEQMDENIYELEKNQTQSNSQIEGIYKKDEQEIFQSKQSYQNFINNYRMGYFLYLILGCSIACLIAIYIAYFFIFTAHNNTIQTITSRVAYQNLIIGSITKQLSFMSSLDLISINKYPDTVARFISIYKDNINQLQNIQLMGQPSFPIVLDLQNINQTFMTNQFILTFIDYANTVIGNGSSPSLSALSDNLKAVDPYIINYLTGNSATTKQVMMYRAMEFLNEVASTITTYQTYQALMFSFGLLYVIIFTVVMILAFHAINKERISIFQIFLDLSDNQIQQYSSKTEKFLFSLHVEQNEGQLDIEDEIENRKKTNSSSFAKRKRFKDISFNKGLYIQLPLIALFFLAFFIQSFSQSKANLSFQLQSYNYFFLISKADYQFFTGLTVIQQNLMNNKSIPTNVSDSFRRYYQQFITAHYNTFEKVSQYHNYFINIFFDDICHGVNTTYGLTKIAESCSLELLYPNGTFLVFTNTLTKTEDFDATTFTYSYLVAFEVISKVHRKITKILVTTQQSIISDVYNNLLNCLMIWIIVCTIVGVVYALVIVKKFIQQINKIKFILTILPISVARQLPLAKGYLSKMIKSRSIC